MSSSANAEILAGGVPARAREATGPQISAALQHVAALLHTRAQERPPIPDVQVDDRAYAWRDGVRVAAPYAGLSAESEVASAREATRLFDSEAFWVTFAPTDSGGTRAYIAQATDKGKLEVWFEVRRGWRRRVMSAHALATAVGADGAASPIDWMRLRTARPLEQLRLPGGPSNKSPLWRVKKLLGLERDSLWIILAFSVAVGVLALATPLAVQVLVNTVAFGTLLQPLVVLVTVLLALLTLAATLRALETVVVEILQRRVFVRAAADIAARLPRTDASLRESKYGPELVNRFFDVITIQKSAAKLLLDGLELALQAIIGLLVVGFYHPLLLAFDVILIAGVVFVVYILGRGAFRTALMESKKKYRVAAWLEDVARSPLAFRSPEGSRSASDRAEHLASDYIDARRSHFRVVFRQTVGVLALQVVASAALLGLGGWLVLRGELTLGQLVASELIVTAVVGSIAKLGKHFESTYDLATGVAKLGQIIDLELEPDGSSLLEHVDSPPPISLRHAETVDRSGRKSLTNISLDVRAGERVVITGPACGGKSGLLELIYGMRPIKGGRVLIADQSLHLLSREHLRAVSALVRDAEIVGGTIEENLRIGNPDASGQELADALKQAHLWDELERYPQGLKTVLAPGGAPLSQSQKLRLTLARALLRKPKILLVDGLLDGLDPEVRDCVLDTLLDPKAGWTLLLVSQHPDVLRRVPRQIRMASTEIQSDTVIATESGGSTS